MLFEQYSHINNEWRAYKFLVVYLKQPNLRLKILQMQCSNFPANSDVTGSWKTSRPHVLYTHVNK